MRELGTMLATTRCISVTANVVHSSQILPAVKMEATRSTETSVPTRTTRRHIPEDGILHSHSREHLRPYM
jgi:hypothetical protein